MEALIALALVLLVLGALVVVPLMLVLAAVRAFVWLVVLPFKLIGLVLGAVGALLGGVFKLAAGLVAFAGLLVVAVVGLVALPVIPLLFVAATVWLIARAARPRTVARAAAP